MLLSVVINWWTQGKSVTVVLQRSVNWTLVVKEVHVNLNHLLSVHMATVVKTVGSFQEVLCAEENQ